MRMRRSLLLLTLLSAISLTARAEVRFVSPLQGSQAYGPTALEIATSTPKVDRVDFYVDGKLVGVARKPPYRIIYDFGDSIASRTVTARLYFNDFANVESAEVQTMALASAASINVDLVEVPFHAHFSHSPSPKDIVIKEDGVPQNITEIRNERGAAAFVFVVDRSLSMSGAKLDAALEAMRAFRAQLRPGDSASVVFFNHRVEPAVPLASALQQDAPNASGGTSLRDALVSINPKQRTYVIVLSDGGDRNSIASQQKTLNTLARRNVSLYAVLLGDGNAEALLEKLASVTGGSVRQSDARHLSAALKAVGEEINSRYVAVYQSNSRKSGWRSIDVRSRKATITSARKGYFAE